ncbi:MAG: MmcQ/YjbR family DNA-binding protein [Myxococcales bacterium]|nr:MmcQ/YjbR family DNA-binding protein [Myxococcales bacterium]
MAKDHPKLVKLRKLIARLPETSEKLSHGSPTFWGGKKTFATFHLDHHGDGRVAVWVKSTLDAQDMLVQAAPEVFFVPPYVGPSGWVGVNLAGKPDWKVVEETLVDGYRMVAPKRALKQLDGE